LPIAGFRKSSVLSAVDAAYIAGLIDGEGTIALTRRHRTDGRQLVVSISNTERPLLDWVLSTVGAGKITGKKTYKDHHAPGLTYSVSNRQALTLLEQVAPHLRTYKAARAQLVLQDYLRLTPRNGRYTARIKSEREAMVIRFHALTSRHHTS
jgi:hypothetical protein